MKTYQEWMRFVEEQLDAVGAPMSARGGQHRIPADGLQAEYMAAECALHVGKLDSAVSSFIADGWWPDLSDEETFYMMLRLQHAQGTLEILANADHTDPTVADCYGAPPLDNYTAFVRWMLVDIWGQFAAQYLAAWIEESAKRNPPTPREHSLPDPELDSIIRAETGKSSMPTPQKIKYTNGQAEALTFATLSITERYQFIDLLVAGDTPQIVALCARRKIAWVNSLDPSSYLDLASHFVKENFKMAMEIATRDPIAGLKVGPLLMQIDRTLASIPGVDLSPMPESDSPPTPAPEAVAAETPEPPANTPTNSSRKPPAMMNKPDLQTPNSDLR